MVIDNENKGSIKVHVVFNIRNRKWMLSAGLIQGIINKLQIKIYNENSLEVGIAQITQINPENSHLKIIQGKLDIKEAYIADIREYQDNSLKLYYEGSQNELLILRKTVEQNFEEFLIQETKEYNNADFIVSIIKSNYIITFPNNHRPVILPLATTDISSLETLKRIFWDLSKWNYVKKLTSSFPTIPKGKVVVQVYKAENEDNFKKDILLKPNNRKIHLKKSDKIRLRVKNNDNSNNFFCSLLALGTSFEISSDFLEGRIREIKSAQQIQVWEGDAIYLEDIFSKNHIKDNWKEIEFHLKLIVSSEPFDVFLFESPGVPIPYSDLERYNLLRMIRRRAYFSPKDWTTSDVTVVIKNPDYREKGQGISNYLKQLKSNLFNNFNEI
jgi:hypothetical protein